MVHIEETINHAVLTHYPVSHQVILAVLDFYAPLTAAGQNPQTKKSQFIVCSNLSAKVRLYTEQRLYYYQIRSLHLTCTAKIEYFGISDF